MDTLKRIQTIVGTVADGIWGPLTKKAVNTALGLRWNATIKSIQNKVGAIEDGALGPQTLGLILQALEPSSTGKSAGNSEIIDLAKGEVGTKEITRNQGPGIGKYWKATWYPRGYANREPYCAAFVCWVLKTAGVKNPPRTPRAFGMEAWGTKTGRQVTYKPKSVKKGDVVVFSFSHVGIAIEDSKGGYVRTVEANTSAGNKGSQRDGGGVYERKRSLSLIRSKITP